MREILRMLEEMALVSDFARYEALDELELPGSCTFCGEREDLDDRGEYLLCSNCSQEQRECKERQRTGEMLDRDCSELCVRCGICCIALSAEVAAPEVQRLAEWSGRLPTEIAMIETLPFAGAGKVVMRRPCVFLLGKPGEYVSCRAYGMDRPDVCGAYLCKLAVRYKAGVCSLNEALFILRASISHRGDISMFNWSSDGNDGDDNELARLLVTERALKTLKDQSTSGDTKIALFEHFRPSYRFASEAHETIFAAIMANYRGNALALNQFFDEESIENMSDQEREMALRTVKQVVGDISEFFVAESRTKKTGR